MDNVIFMSELCDAATNCSRTINSTVNNFSNIVNSSSNASNTAQNAVKNIDSLIQEVTPNIGNWRLILKTSSGNKLCRSN